MQFSRRQSGRREYEMRLPAVVAATFAAVAATNAAAQSTTTAPSAAQVGLASEIVDALNPSDSPLQDTFLRTMTARMQAIAAAHPGQLPDAATAKMWAENMARSFRKAQVLGWADTYDEVTLRGLLAFYRSPAGTAYLRGRTSLAAHTQAEIGTASHTALRDLFDEFCKAQGCTPEKRAALDALANGPILDRALNTTPPAVPHAAGVPANVISHPLYSARPTAADLGQYYPERGLRLGLTGKVGVLCDVGAEGAVTGCALLSEEPADVGFGYAATRVASFFKLEALDGDGRPVAGRKVVIKMNFALPPPKTATGGTRAGALPTPISTPPAS